ncbi:MAG: NEW3 domain-containing protein [Ilumatobacteraceae bacterium]
MSHRWSPRHAPFVLATLACVLAVALAAPATGSVHADAALSVTTPYPSIETQPGSTVKLDVHVTSGVVEPVDLRVDGLPDGWTAILRGGGFVVHAVTAAPVTTTNTTPATVSLEVDVPADAAAGAYPFTVTGTDPDGTVSQAKVTLQVAEQVDSGIKITADFPSLSGDPGSAFTYNLTVTNDTPEQQTFTFSPTAPEGWTVTASPAAQSKANTVTIDGGGNTSVTVTATPPATVTQGNYPIDVAVSAANGAQGKIELQAQVTGTPTLALATASQQLNVSGASDTVKRIPLVVSNTGTASLENVKLAGTAPTGWDVSFDPQQLTEVKPNETAQVTAIVKPSSNAVAGDYAITVRASAGSESSSVDLRYSLSGSSTLGIVAIVVIVLAVLALVGVFVRFGRR